MKQITNKRIITILLIPILFIPITSIGYAHFTDLVVKQYKIHVKCLNVEIGTYKVLSPWDDELIEKYPPDDDLPSPTLQISTKIFPGWYVWIGFILQNYGSFPAWVDSPRYDVVSDPPNMWDWFTVNEYFYGPWARNDVPKRIYDHVYVPSWRHLSDPLPPNALAPPPLGNVPTPIYLEPAGSVLGQHNIDSMVMWIFLKFSENYPINNYPFTISITITIVATM